MGNRLPALVPSPFLSAVLLLRMGSRFWRDSYRKEVLRMPVIAPPTLPASFAVWMVWSQYSCSNLHSLRQALPLGFRTGMSSCPPPDQKLLLLSMLAEPPVWPSCPFFLEAFRKPPFASVTLRFRSPSRCLWLARASLVVVGCGVLRLDSGGFRLAKLSVPSRRLRDGEDTGI